ncbi:MAG: hypothetical protein ACRDT4_00515 [Micromonosporaceae bacterium]
MGKLQQLRERMSVTVQSPDNDVTITVAGPPADPTIKVQLVPGCTREHTEESLASQVDAAVRLAIAAYRQRVHATWRQAAG